jgi:hypothetical protein
MNYGALSYSAVLCFCLMYFYILLISFIFSCSNGASYLWQMVHMRTGNFVLNVLEGYGAYHGAAPTRPCGAAPEAPPMPPITPTFYENKFLCK